jgi:predicted lysophospholipase L1 biosynthesis ABC-type transport system permease subunit
MRALRIIVAIEAATLAVAVGLVLHSEDHKGFPPALAVTLPSPAPPSRVIPVSINLGSTGRTKTAAILAPTRGGRAGPTRTLRSESGSVGFRHTAAALPSHPR